VETFIIVLHIVVALFLIVVVLLQAGKGASIGATFGGSSQTVFGSRGPASFLGKVTTIAAAVFMITSLTLSVIYSQTSKSSLAEKIQQPQTTQQAIPTEAEDGFDPFKAAEKNMPQAGDNSATGPEGVQK
jgi:preprotein translocase subunit SecG